MPDLSDTVAKCRMGTAKKFYTSIASLSHTSKPLRLLVTLAATFPINGDSFWVFIYSAYVFFTISISSSHIFSRLCMLMNSLLPWKL